MQFPIVDLLAKRAELSPDRVALEDLQRGTRLSFLQLEQHAARCAGMLAALGVVAGDRVAVLCRNRPAFFELLFACGKLGAILVPLNWRMPAAELAGLVKDCEPGVLLHGDEDRDVAAAACPASVPSLNLDSPGPDGFCARRDASHTCRGRGTWEASEIWYLLYTSGTTGQPKAVIQTYGMALANYINVSQAMGLRTTDTTLCYLPMFHTAGINLVALPTLIDGGTVLILPGFEIEHLMDLIGAGRLDNFFAVPNIYQSLSQHPRFDQIDLSSVRSWGCGGAALPTHLIREFARRGARVKNGMGMTETGPTVFLMDEASVTEKIGSVGKPQLLSEARIVDAEGHDVDQDETGELWFAGPGITPGYWRRPDATARAFSVDGWLRSGDLARRDADGYYYIVGRIKEMYISGGENVYPAEVEKVLASHPDVMESAVVAMHDPRWGEVGCAFLLPGPNGALPAAEALTAFCRQRLAAYKIPRRFIEVSDFPRTAAGKVQKHLLKAER